MQTIGQALVTMIGSFDLSHENFMGVHLKTDERGDSSQFSRHHLKRRRLSAQDRETALHI
jgi:hypothetical protein